MELSRLSSTEIPSQTQTSPAPATAPRPAPVSTRVKFAATRATSTFKAATSLSQKGIDLIKGFEGLRLTSYRDPGGVLTIGYGHTGSDVRSGQTISKARAEELLRHDTGWAQEAVRSAVRVPLSSGQFDALTSFTFNLGAGALRSSTLLKKLNAHDYAGAQKEFGKWVHAGGEVLAGLVRRRVAEAKMFGNTAPKGGTAPSPTPPSPSPGKKIDYRVRAGDTFSGIAARKGLTTAQLHKLNPQVKNINRINVGQLIHIKLKKSALRPAPKTTSYTVRSGDTFGGIASTHHMTVAALAKLNPQVTNINVINVGQKLKLKAASSPTPRPTHTPTPTPAPTPTPGPIPAHGGIPNTAGLSTAKRYAIYEKYIWQFGDAQARRDLAAGKRVILSLRQDTPMTADRNPLGTYDDRIVVLWKDGSGPHVQEEQANTEPNRRWSLPANASSKPVGRLADNQTIRYYKAWSSTFGNHLEPYGNPFAQRDTNRDFRFEKNEKSYNGDWGGQAMFIHRAWEGNTGSQGCQTMEENHFNNFWNALGSQNDVSYVLVNVTR